MATPSKHSSRYENIDEFQMTPAYFRENPVRCDKLGGGCNKRFADVIEMKLHKFEQPDHFYCKTCDVDCESYDALTQHKVDVMAPYIEKKVRPSEVKPKHIVCEFCGRDFPTFGGRKLHRQQIHPAQQDLVCLARACQGHFVRAADLVKHWEEDRCPGISRYQFLVAIQQKHIMRQIMVDPRNFIDKRYGEADDNATESSLMSHQSGDQNVGSGALQAPLRRNRDNQKKAADLLEDKVESWPGLPNAIQAQPRKSYELVSRQGQSLQTTSGHGGKSYADMVDCWSSTSSVTRDQLSETMGRSILHEHSPSTAKIGNTTGLRPWQSRAGGPSQSLHSRSTNDALSQSEHSLAPVLKGQDLMTARWWDKTRTQEYNLEAFYNPVENRYRCPFADCEREFNWEDELAIHIQEWHAKVQFRCLCVKLFKTVAALVAHSESPGSKCNASKDPAFREMIHLMTGGFLQAHTVEQHGILPTNTHSQALTLRRGSAYGVMETKYEIAQPDLW